MIRRHGHPLTDVLTKVATREPLMAVAEPPFGPEFRPPSAIADDVTRVLGAVASNDALRSRVTAFELAWRVGRLAGPALASIALSRRVPDLAVRNIAVRELADGQGWQLGLRTKRFLCLAGDQAADHADAVVVANVSVLRVALRDAYVLGWGGEVIRVIASASPVAERALWGMAASAWAAAFGHVVALGGDPRATVIEAEGALDLDPRLRSLPLRFYTTDEDGSFALRHWRGVCCLYYQTSGGEYCEGACPLLPAGRAALMIQRESRWVERGERAPVETSE
jgi:hypothetical protein